jgi:hypothetical protein
MICAMLKTTYDLLLTEPAAGELIRYAVQEQRHASEKEGEGRHAEEKRRENFGQKFGCCLWPLL